MAEDGSLGSPHLAAQVLRSLDLDQKAALTAGDGIFSVAGIDAAGIPQLFMTDGPNGARGPTTPRDDAERTTCVPCGSALGATWDPALLEEVGALLAQEALAKNCRVLLAPTVNLVRSPLGGRNFECYGEDPLLTGHLAVAFVRGAQGQGVATTVKHFVANDGEFERMTMSSVVDERTLRELYLVPFEMAVREGHTLGIMTGYNRLNGTWCGEHEWLLSQVLRGEWGFEGIVVSDWYAEISTVASALAGSDIEMPGPPRGFGPALAAAVRDGSLDESVLDAQASRILAVYERLGLLSAEQAPVPGRPDPAVRSDVARRAAASSMVLLKNEGVLPLAPDVRKVALVGPGAASLSIMGGGSAQVRCDPVAKLPDALAEALGGDVEVVCEPGVDIARSWPTVKGTFVYEFFAGPGWQGEPVHRAERPSAQCTYLGDPFESVPRPFSLRATGTFVPEAGGPHELSLSETGRARVLLDGQVVLDGLGGARRRGPSFIGMGLEPLTATVELTEGKPVDLVVEYDSDGDRSLNGFEVGCRSLPSGDPVARAVAAAGAADVAVVVVGTTKEWESEGFDRATMALPGDQDELVDRVLAANPRTVMVVNTGAPVEMPWADRVPAVLQAWFGGQEMPGALAEVLTGAREPGGRLPVTLGRRDEDNPAFGNFPGEHDEMRYGERLLVGYRWYEARKLAARFPFGHGLSYTSFEIGEPTLSSATWQAGEDIVVTVPVRNVGSRRGSEVVQCYVEAPPSPVLRPKKELRAFQKIELEPGEENTVTLVLGHRSFARFDPGGSGGDELRARLALGSLMGSTEREAAPASWTVDAGTHWLHIGRSSADIAWRLNLDASHAVQGVGAPFDTGTSHTIELR